MGKPLNYASRDRATGRRTGRKVVAGVVTAMTVGAALYTSLAGPAPAPPAFTWSEVFSCPTTQPTAYPSAGAEKWDFGGGSNTALNWSNWNNQTSTQPISR